MRESAAEDKPYSPSTTSSTRPGWISPPLARLIDPKRQNESYGRFAWIKDQDGNRVELWQPLETPEP